MTYRKIYVANRAGWVVLLATLALAVGAADANQMPPDGSRSLKEIVTGLELDGYRIVEASFDDGRWELDGYRKDESYELHVDPKTGHLLSTERDDADPAPSANALPLSQILELVAQAGYGPIVDAEFEHGRWEIEAYHERARRELRVDAMTGKILSSVAG